MKKAVTICFFALIVQAAWSQGEKLVNPADLKQQTVITEPLSLNKGFFRTGFIYSHVTVDKYFDESGDKNFLPESTWGSINNLQFWAQYGITDRIMVELGIPYTSDITNIHFKYIQPDSDQDELYNASNKATGMGDVMASATYQIIPSADNNFSVKASVDVTFPTGRKNFKDVVSEDEFNGPAGYGVFSLTPVVTARMLLYPYSFIAKASFNYNFRGSRMLYPTDAHETSIRDGYSIRGGLGISMHLNEWIALTNDISYSYWGKDKIEGVPDGYLSDKWALTYEPRIVFQIRRFRLGEAVNIPLRAKYYGADPLYVLMVQYVF